MEKLSQVLSEGLERQTRGSQSQSIQANTLTETELYSVKVFEVVRRVAVLSNRTATNAEIKEARDVWMETLQPIIPVADLVPSFNRACKNKRDGFPPTAFDLVVAHRELEEERAEEKRREAEKRYTCPKTITVMNPWNFSEDITLPCPKCRHADYLDAKSRLSEKYRSAVKPLELVEKFRNENLLADTQ